MSMIIRFAGDRVVHAETKGFTVATDVPAEPGGAVSAPSPVDLLLAGLGTCTSYYVLGYCRQRDLPLEGVHLSVEAAREEGTRKFTGITVTIHLPDGFPEEHVDPILRASSQCTVKKLMQNCPDLQTVVARGT